MLETQLMCSIPLAISAGRPSWLTFEQLEQWTAFSPCLYQLVQDRMYANMVANVVCVSLCHRTHGEGEGLTASSPTEPTGRRQDPVGHLPFWREYIERKNTRSCGNLFGD